jgi:uncharacterized protein
MSDDKLFSRLALMAEISDRWKTKASTLGRTALMKLCFFLQESCGVQLGYNFSLYSYGPFDSDVLSDLGTAVRLNVLKEGIVYYSSGTGYEYQPGSDIGSAKDLASDFLMKNTTKIQWAVDTFGNKTAGELELLSTAFFVAKYQNPADIEHLIDQVELIKPHFSRDQIKRGVDELFSLKLLRSQPATK